MNLPNCIRRNVSVKNKNRKILWDAELEHFEIVFTKGLNAIIRIKKLQYPLKVKLFNIRLSFCELYPCKLIYKAISVRN